MQNPLTLFSQIYHSGRNIIEIIIFLQNVSLLNIYYLVARVIMSISGNLPDIPAVYQFKKIGYFINDTILV